MSALSSFLDRFFKIRSSGSSVKTEVIAGITIYLTMSYIVMVNPDILSNAGMDKGAVFVATCLAAGLGCLLMGMLTNYPIALAPSIGMNAYFAYSVCIGMKIPWQVALAAVFVSGLIFVLLSLSRFRGLIVNGIPKSLKFAIIAGIGFFLAVIALRNIGVIVVTTDSFISMGDVHHPVAALSFVLIVVLDYFRVIGAIAISIFVVTLISALLNLSPWNGIVGSIPPIAPTFGQMDFRTLFVLQSSGDFFTIQLISVIFVFFLVDLSVSTGTILGVAHRAGFLKNGVLPHLQKTLLADSVSTVTGAALGTSSTTASVESVTGIAAGGKTGLTVIVVGVLFLVALLFSPLVMSVPPFAAAPALLYVGILMVRGLAEINWNDITEAAPAFLTAALMPLTFSIANGIAVGFISYAVIKLLCGKAQTVSPIVWVVAFLWVLKFSYFGV